MIIVPQEGQFQGVYIHKLHPASRRLSSIPLANSHHTPLCHMCTNTLIHVQGSGPIAMATRVSDVDGAEKGLKAKPKYPGWDLSEYLTPYCLRQPLD